MARDRITATNQSNRDLAPRLRRSTSDAELVDAAYENAYSTHPIDAEDEWGDLASFRIAAAHRDELLRRGAQAVLDAKQTAAADRELQAAYRRQPPDAALALSARRLATKTTEAWSEQYLTELNDEVGEPSWQQHTAADALARRIREHIAREPSGVDERQS